MITTILIRETHWLLFFGGTILLLLFVVEAGYRFGQWRSERADPEQKSQTGAVFGGLLALLGFLLAISFGIAADRFAQRKALVLEEANAIGTAFLRTDFLPQPQAEASKKLLLEYVDTVLLTSESDELDKVILQGEAIQNKLWQHAGLAAAADPRSIPIGLYIQVLNDVIDLAEERVTVGMLYHIPPSLIWALYFVSLLAMWVMGVNFGLARTRNLTASVALVSAFAAILLLIVDLDQVHQHLFTVHQTPLEDVKGSIRESMAGSTGSTALEDEAKELQAPSLVVPSKDSP